MNLSLENGHVVDTRSNLRPAVGLALLSLVLFGFFYTLGVSSLGRILFPHAAQGSLITREGVIVGSSLVAQPFVSERYFHPRPSASAYNPMAVSGSNQARSNLDLRTRIEATVIAVTAREGITPEQVPSDLVTQSGGGGDPHISPAAAQIQIARVAKARNLDAKTVEAVVARFTEAPQWGLFGQARVNVLALNLALDSVAAN